MSRNKDWTDEEIRIVIEDYFHMFKKEYFGAKLVKKEHWTALIPKLSGRTRPAIEYKYQNISGVLMDLGLKRIKGYKPKVHYQNRLKELVEEYLQQNYDIKEMVALPTETPSKDEESRNRCVYRRARFEDGQCPSYALEGSSLCKMHQDKATFLFKTEEKEKKDGLIEKYWDEALEDLLVIYPQLSLNEIFGFVKISLEEIDYVNVSFRYIQNWYRRTQGNKGHPIDIIDLKYTHLLGSTPYLEVMKKFGTKEMPRREKFARERVIEYMEKNPDALAHEVSKITDVKDERVRQFCKEEGIKLISREVRILKTLKDYLDKYPWRPAAEVSMATSIHESTVRRYAEKYNLKLHKRRKYRRPSRVRSE